jgi:hypothetical protein
MSELSKKLNNLIIDDDIYSEVYVRAINDQIFERVINPTYFRPKFIGFDEPLQRSNPERAVIMASNHSGMAFPWDAVVFGCGMYKKFDYDVNKAFRPLAAPALSAIRIMNPFMLQDCWKLCGGIDATFKNFETAMANPYTNLLIYPEGIPGIGKGFNRKYELQRLATSFVKMAIKHETDIVTFSTVNAEYVNPYSYSFDWINRVVQKIGIPFLPISFHAILIFIQPWAFYLSFPANIHYVYGRRIKHTDLTDKEYESMTGAEITEATNKVKNMMQEDLIEAVSKYGKRPIQWGEMWKQSWANRRFFPYYYPFMWPFLFCEFERQWIKHLKSNNQTPIEVKLGWFAFLRLLLLNPIILCYYIPLVGWIPLAIKGYTKHKMAKT